MYVLPDSRKVIITSRFKKKKIFNEFILEKSKNEYQNNIVTTFYKFYLLQLMFYSLYNKTPIAL